MNFGFMFDKFLDAGDARTAKRQADIIMHALRNPLHPRPEGEWVVGEMARQ
jgi:Delta6-protoilludene synthase